MIINQLRVTNLRAFHEAEFNFHPGMNLLVGVNGVGKSTVLDAIRILLSQMMPKISDSTSIPIDFKNDDISITKKFLTSKLTFGLGQKQYSYSIQRTSSRINFKITEQCLTKLSSKEVPNSILTKLKSLEEEILEKNDFLKKFKDAIGESQAEQFKKLILENAKLPTGFSQAGIWLFPPIDTKKKQLSPEEIDQKTMEELSFIRSQNPLPIFYSPHRSTLKPSLLAKNGISSVHSKALEIRYQLNLNEFVNWWIAYEALAKEGVEPGQTVLKALEEAVSQFTGCSNLHAVSKPKKTLLIKKSGLMLDVQQLSDGERGILALVLDLTRRLAQANPYLENPAKDGKAIVLIDELDLHLHPKWQRTIVGQLTRTFPNCQFIATTHSPQIISSVSPENIILLEPGKLPIRPDQSLGMDTNWILKFLMETDERDHKYQIELEEIEKLIEDDEYEIAQDRIDKLRGTIGVFPDLVRLQTKIDFFTS